MRIEERDGNFVIVDFNELEAYRIACKIEKDGLEFYATLLERMDKHEPKNALAFLLNEEKKHLSIFERSVSKLRQQRQEEDTSEDNDLLDSLNYGIFRAYENAAELTRIVASPSKALRLGILIEDHSIRFYEALKDKVTSQETKNEISKIIMEELRHKQLLEETLSQS